MRPSFKRLGVAPWLIVATAAFAADAPPQKPVFEKQMPAGKLIAEKHEIPVQVAFPGHHAGDTETRPTGESVSYPQRAFEYRLFLISGGNERRELGAVRGYDFGKDDLWHGEVVIYDAALEGDMLVIAFARQECACADVIVRRDGASHGMKWTATALLADDPSVDGVVCTGARIAGSIRGGDLTVTVERRGAAPENKVTFQLVKGEKGLRWARQGPASQPSAR